MPNLVTLFDRQKSSISEEDPYSIPGNNSSSSGSRSSGHYVSTGPVAPNGKSSSGSEQKPPKLPPRDFERKQKSKNSKKSKSNLKDSEENNYTLGSNNPRIFGSSTNQLINVRLM